MLNIPFLDQKSIKSNNLINCAHCVHSDSLLRNRSHANESSFDASLSLYLPDAKAVLKHPNLPHALASAVDVSGFNLSKDAYFDKPSMVSGYGCCQPNIVRPHLSKQNLLKMRLNATYPSIQWNCGMHQCANNAHSIVHFVVFLSSNNACGSDFVRICKQCFVWYACICVRKKVNRKQTLNKISEWPKECDDHQHRPFLGHPSLVRHIVFMYRIFTDEAPDALFDVCLLLNGYCCIAECPVVDRPASPYRILIDRLR